MKTLKAIIALLVLTAGSAIAAQVQSITVNPLCAPIVVGQKATVTWSTKGIAPGARINIELVDTRVAGDNASSIITIGSTTANGSFKFTVPCSGSMLIGGYNCYIIRVSTLVGGNKTIEGLSSLFSISFSEKLQFIAPNGVGNGTVWNKGVTELVLFSCVNGVNDVAELSFVNMVTGRETVIADNQGGLVDITANGTFYQLIVVPANLPTGLYRIKATLFNRKGRCTGDFDLSGSINIQ